MHGPSLQNLQGGNVGLITEAVWGKVEGTVYALEHKAELATKLNYKSIPEPSGEKSEPGGSLSCQHEALPGSSRSFGMEPFLSICQEGPWLSRPALKLREF